VLGSGRLHSREHAFKSLIDQGHENSFFVVKVLIDGGLAVFNTISDFACGDRLPALLNGNLTRS